MKKSIRIYEEKLQDLICAGGCWYPQRMRFRVMWVPATAGTGECAAISRATDFSYAWVAGSRQPFMHGA